MELHTFDFRDQLIQAVTDFLADSISESIEKYGDARILLSGGSTPWPVYKKLSNIELDWEKVHVGLVDERFVTTDDEHSNERLLRETLIQNNAESATLTGMVFNPTNRSENLKWVQERYAPFMERTDAIILGMGGDGHTASLFPSDVNSEADLESSTIGIINTLAPSHPENRISCSKALILNSRKIAILITGSSKLEVLNDTDKRLPIHRLLEERSNIETYYAE